MKKIIIVLAFISFLLSCESEETKYLYDENDSEYNIFVEAASAECISTSNFFTTFDAYNDFSNAIFKKDKIYKILQDSPPVTTYVKVKAVNANDVTLIYSSNSNDYDKILTFEESDHASIGDFLKIAVCNKNYNLSYFTSISGLDSSTTLGFKWFKESISIVDDDDADTEPEVYDRRYDSLSVNLNYPSFFYFYNGTKVHKYVQAIDGKEETVESKITITDVTGADECNEATGSTDENCKLATFNAVTRNCSISVVASAYSLRPHDSKELVLAGDVGCDNSLLKSNGGF